jgi:hypothetical protein
VRSGVKVDLGIVRERRFRHFFLARAVSLLGTSMMPPALAFAILGRPGGSAAAIGVILGCRAVALVAFLLLGGALADRLSRYRLMVASDVVAFAAQAAVAGLFISGSAPLVLVGGLSAVTGAATGVFYPASRGLIPQIVENAQLQPANALTRLAENSASLGGAAISGVIIVTVGAGWALAIDAATFLVSAGLLLTSRIPVTVRAQEQATMLADLRAGWQEVRSRQWLWVIIAQFALINLCFSPSIVVLGPVIARQHWGGALGWSVILTAQAVGLTAGSLVAIRLRPAFPLLVGTIVTFALAPPLFLLAIHAPVWLVAAQMLVTGVTMDIFEVLWLTALQHHIPADKLSRVASFEALGSFGLGPLGLLIVGPVSAVLGIPQTLIGAGGLIAVATLGALLITSVRTLPAKPPSPP